MDLMEQTKQDKVRKMILRIKETKTKSQKWVEKKTKKIKVLKAKVQERIMFS